jgi:hypothetical protein
VTRLGVGVIFDPRCPTRVIHDRIVPLYELLIAPASRSVTVPRSRRS